MRCESLDRRIRAELKSLNTGLLRLLAWQEPAPARGRFGLDPAITAGLQALGTEELEYIAGTPVLLAGFASARAAATAARIADAEFTRAKYAAASDDPLSRLTSLFAAALLTWLWKTHQHDELLTALCVGPERRLPPMNIATIEALAGQASQRLCVRFGEHPRFWPDLIRAARSRNDQLRELSRLAALPLLLTERPDP